MAGGILFKYSKNSVHPYTLIAVAWCSLGIGTGKERTTLHFKKTGIVAPFALSRLIFISVSWFLFEAGWDYLDYYRSDSYSGDDDRFWTKLRLRVISYSRPLFYMWLGVMVHHIIWWQSGFIILDETYILAGWGQETFILLCTSLSFFGSISKAVWRRSYLKWAMMVAAFLLPPWRDPWYTEPLIIIQVRWIIIALLFVVQCFESYSLANVEKRYLADLYLLRIGWVPLVHPILLLYAIISFLYYGFTMIKIRIETAMPSYEHSILRTIPQKAPVYLSYQQNSTGIAQILENPAQEENTYPGGWEQFSRFTIPSGSY